MLKSFACAALLFVAALPAAAQTAPRPPQQCFSTRDIRNVAAVDDFTVNLRDDGGDHYAQIGVTLELEDATIENDLKTRLPALRNNILLLIASRTSPSIFVVQPA